MRDGNITNVARYLVTKLIGLERSYEGWKQFSIQYKNHSRKEKFRKILWGMETFVLIYGVCSTKHTFRKILWGMETFQDQQPQTQQYLCLERSYEGWKLFDRFKCVWHLDNAFRKILWGMETGIKIPSRLHSTLWFRKILWGMETNCSRRLTNTHIIKFRKILWGMET